MDSRFIGLLPDLALFVAIGEADSLSAASRATGAPVARLSRRLAALERTVGVRLVERTPRRFPLTAEGEAYLASLAPTLGAVADADSVTTEELHGRVFVQLGEHDEVGRMPGPAPLDVDRGGGADETFGMTSFSLRL